MGKSTNMVLFPKEKVPYSTWYFFPLVLFPSIPEIIGLERKQNGFEIVQPWRINWEHAHFGS